MKEKHYPDNERKRAGRQTEKEVSMTDRKAMLPITIEIRDITEEMDFPANRDKNTGDLIPYFSIHMTHGETVLDGQAHWEWVSHKTKWALDQIVALEDGVDMKEKTRRGDRATILTWARRIAELREEQGILPHPERKPEGDTVTA